MVTLSFQVVDAFTSSPFSGNPCAVIELLPSSTFSTETLQAIASKFNLSETAFIVSLPRTGPEDLRFSLRWFTPTVEVPLCGHGTLATAKTIFSKPETKDAHLIEFETLSGVLKARKVSGNGRIELEFPALLPEVVDDVTKNKVVELVEEAVGHSVPIVEVQYAKWFAIIRIDQAFDLEASVVNAGPFNQLAPQITDIILTSDRSTILNPSARFISRVFGPITGVDEDPVTGSAHCALAPYWYEVLSVKPGTPVAARQASRRGGDLELVWEKEKGTVKLRGEVVVVSKGEMCL